jgi:hypothetical protein
MSLSEILSLAVPTAQTPPATERPDGELFGGLMQDLAVPAGRGRLGVGRWLRSEAETTTTRLDESDPRVLPGTVVPWIERPLINPGPNAEPKPSGPLINPGPSAESKPMGPLINPGPSAEAKPAGPLINPGVEGQTKTDQPLVLGATSDPTGQLSPADVTDASGSVVRPTTGALQAALSALSTNGQSQTVTSLAQAAQQAVARTPEEGAAPQGTPAPEVPGAELDLTLTPMTPATGSTTTGSGTAGTPASTMNGSGPAETAAQDPATASPASEAVDPASADEGATDLARVEAEVPADPTGTTGRSSRA